MSYVVETPRRAASPDQTIVEESAAAGVARLKSIDLLRGLVMVVMALDHTRDFFAAGGPNPRDVADPALFLTRWVTHFCAPTFILLAGISAFLYGRRLRHAGELSRYLATRGLWLVLIEFTVVGFAWRFSFHFNHFVAQVIFAIGASMIVLAGLVQLPRWAIATLGLVMIAGHNLFDGVKAAQFGAAAPLWDFLHQPAHLQLAPGVDLVVLYPLIPWIGVMAAGYALGPVFTREGAARVRTLFALGVALTAGFILLRATNLYGDPAPWAVQTGPLATVLSFLNCEKYPPSLLYLMMTLGPALMLLAAFEKARGPVAGLLTIYGRVPLFYYVAHLYLLHLLAIVYAWMLTGDVTALIGALHKPAGYGLGLAGVYAVWLFVVVTLYPFCRWFGGVKRRRTEWWWSYL
jgi:uncharacterized membrane protein